MQILCSEPHSPRQDTRGAHIAAAKRIAGVNRPQPKHQRQSRCATPRVDGPCGADRHVDRRASDTV